MSQLASNPAALAACLQMLSDPNMIKAGEAEIKKFTKKETCIGALFQFCASGAAADTPSRLQAALLLKKNISKFLPKFDGNTQLQLRSQMLLLMTRETEKTISTALAGAVAKVAKVVLTAQGSTWPELFETLLRLGQDPNEAMRALDYNLLAQLAEHVSEKLLPHMQTIAQMLTSGCSDSSSAVKKEAMLATSAFLANLSENDEINHLEQVLSPMIDVMNNCLAQGDEDSVREGLEVIQECAMLDKTIINEHLERLIPFTLAIIKSETLESDVKSAACQTILNIVESRPKLLTKKNLVLPILSAMAEIIAASEGSACGQLYTMPSAALFADDEKDDDEDGSYAPSEEMGAAQQAQVILNTMAIHVPSKFFAEPALTMASQCMSSPDPKMRKAGTSIVGIIAEGCSDALRPLLGLIMPSLLAAVRDPDQTVREVACFALGQFSEYLQPDILHFNQGVFPVIAGALEDPAETVKNTACYVLEMFVENLQKETLRPYLPELMKRLAVLLQSPSRVSQEMALSGIGACAVAAETEFAPYTPGMCQMLKQLIFVEDSKQLPLRGRSLECLGHIAVAVGAESFSPYFEDGMNSALQGLKLDDESLKEHSYVFFANAAKVMGASERFAPYFAVVVPTLLEVVNESELMADEADEDNDDEDDAGDDDEFEGDIYVNGEEGFVNGKKAAITALGSFCENCGVHFSQYLEHVMKALMDPEGVGAVDSEHEVIRAESLEVLRYIFQNACKLSGVPSPLPETPKYLTVELPPAIQQLARMQLIQCLKTISEDSYKKPVASALDTIESLLTTAGKALLMLPGEKPDSSIGNILIEQILNLLQEKAECQQKRETTRDLEDEEVDDHDQLVIDSVSDVIGRLAKTLGPEFVPFFDQMLPALLKYCNPKRTFTDKSMAIGCFGEVVAELGDVALKYQDSLLPIVQAGLTDSMEGVRRNSAFFLGKFVESTGTALVPFFGHILSWLYPVCIREDSKKALDAGGADVDNALSAVARMIRVSSTGVPLEQVLPVMLAALPLQSDFSEGLNIFSCLMDLISQGNASVMQFLPQILHALAHTLVAGSKYEDECKTSVASWMVVARTQPWFQPALQQLPPDVQQYLTQ